MMTDDEKAIVEKLARCARAVVDAHDLGTVPLGKMMALSTALRDWDDHAVRSMVGPKTPPPKFRAGGRSLMTPDAEDIDGEPTRRMRMTPGPMPAVQEPEEK